MILNDEHIKHYATVRKMIEPFNPMLVNPASYDLTLHYELIEITPGGIMDPSNTGNAVHKLTSERKIKLSYGQSYLLQPGVFILASSVERVKIPPILAAEVKLKSTTARRGIGHVYSGWIDPGFEGQITFELFSHVPVLLEPGKPIAQIIFNEMIDAPQEPYQGKYQYQEGPTPARSEYENPATSFNANAASRPFLTPERLIHDDLKQVYTNAPGQPIDSSKAFGLLIPYSVDQVWSDARGNVHVKEPHGGKEHILSIEEIYDNMIKNIHPAQTVADFIESIVNPKSALSNLQELVQAVAEDFGPGHINFDIAPNVNSGPINAPLTQIWVDAEGKPLDIQPRRPINKVDRDWAEENDL